MEDGISQLIRIQGLLLLLILSALFSALEVSFLSLSKSKLKSLEDMGMKGIKRYLEFKEQPEEFLQAILVGNNLVNVLAAVLATVIFSEALVKGGATVAAVSVSLVIILFGEIIPKTFGSYRGERVLMSLNWFTTLIVVLFKPLTKILNWLSFLFLSPLGFHKGMTPHTISLEEVKAVVEMGEEHGSVEEEEKKMIHGVFSLGHTYVYEVMIPRVDMVALEANTPLEEALNIFVEGGHSRVPIYEETIDNVIGIVHSKDILRKLITCQEEEFTLKEVMREVYFIPETKKVDDLLREMRAKKVSLAIVLDEYGGVAGLVALEDLIEEIVGDIKDEFDKEEIESELTKISDNQYIAQGRVLLEDLQEILGLDFPEERSYETLAGYIYAKSGHLPQTGEIIEDGFLKMEVLEVKGRRISKVKLSLEESTSNDF